MMSGKENLQQLRTKIRAIDDQLLDLMAERLKLAREVGKVKLEANIPIKNFEIEKEIINKARKKARSLELYADLAEGVSKLQIRYAVMAQEEYHTHNRSEANDQSIKKITIIGGCGKMGLWLARFFDSFGHQVTISDEAQHRNQAGDFSFDPDLESACRHADFIVLATPISVTGTILQRLSELPLKGILFDICSLKSPILDQIHAATKAGLKVTSIHPMFGPGTDLLSGQNIVFCETEHPLLTEQVRALFNNTTANLVSIPIEKHDQLMGYVLGMSHLLNFAFAKALTDGPFSFAQLKEIASSTFRSQLKVVEPIINENQDLYYEIQSGNLHTQELIAQLIKSFEDYRDAIHKKQRDKFKSFIERSRLFFSGN